MVARSVRALCTLKREHDSSVREQTRLEQGEGKDGVVVAAQVRAELVGPGQAQQQVAGHEVVVEGLLEEQLACQNRFLHAAAALVPCAPNQATSDPAARPSVMISSALHDQSWP